MKDIFENKLSMYQKVQGYLTNKAAETAGIPAVATLKTQLDTDVSVLQGHATIADADFTGHTVDKQNTRKALNTALLKVSTAVVAYASMTNNNKLLEKCDETASAIDYMRDNDFYTYAQTVNAEATPIVVDLGDYGVVAADLTNLGTAMADFLAIIQDPRLQINERSNAQLQLEKSFATVDDLLKNKLDKVMTVFITSNPALYTGYLGARAIDDDGGANATPDYELTATRNSTELIAAIPYLSSRQFRIKNDGSTPLIFALSDNITDMQGDTVTVEAGQERIRITPNLNSDSNAANLLVQNNEAQDADFRIWITE